MKQTLKTAAEIAVIITFCTALWPKNKPIKCDEPVTVQIEVKQEKPKELPLSVPFVIVDAAELTEAIPVEKRWTDEEVTVLSKMVWGEAGSIKSDTEKAAVVWCALNLSDANNEDIISTVTTPGRFYGYRKNNPVVPEIQDLVADVLERWYNEKDGCENVGRVLPPDYLYFSGDGFHNRFRNKYEGGSRWDWSLPSPYET